MIQIIYQNTPIFVGYSFSRLAEYLPKDSSHTVLLVDENVMRSGRYDFRGYQCISIPAGEGQKSLVYVEKLIEQLLAIGADRKSFLVGVGGGVVCDITGFVASIFMRGIRFGFVPTTLLAQVDASIGGKNGVNTGLYKNMIGTFTQPAFILIDEQFLQTLPHKELVSGMAEVVKHACIRNADYFDYIEQNTEAILALKSGPLRKIILESVAIKAAIVDDDEKELGPRKLLNFGHTFGHAIEKKYGFAHGEAVSLGMVIVNEIAVLENKLDAPSEARIKSLLAKIGLPTDLSAIDLPALKELVIKDKKQSSGIIDLILLNKVGAAERAPYPIERLDGLVNLICEPDKIGAVDASLPNLSGFRNPRGLIQADFDPLMSNQPENQVKIVKPFAYQGEMTAPASKSYLQRAIAIASLCDKPCHIQNYYPSNDAKAAIGIAKSLGALVEENEDSLIVQKGNPANHEILMHCGESGLSTRMFSPIAATFARKTIVTGEGSLLNRPIRMIEEALEQMDVEPSSNNGLLPLEFRGPLRAAEIAIDGSESSQLLTGLLIALPTIQGNSVVKVKNLKSIPYIQMTLDILAHFGIQIKHEGYERFEIAGNQIPNAHQYQVEGDWSGAAFHLVGAAISGSVVMKGLNLASSQADIAILEVLKCCGAKVATDHGVVSITKDRLEAFTFDATHCPDLFPPLAVLAACCEGESEIIGISRLKNKESDRAQTILEEFAKLNIKVHLDGDTMRISKSKVQGGNASSRNDHRIAMALAILATVSEGEIGISGSQALDKSYPSFFEGLGGNGY